MSLVTRGAGDSLYVKRLTRIYPVLLTRPMSRSMHRYAPKRSKHTITTSSRRMSVTSLTVNDSLGLDGAGRRRLRAAVHRIEKDVALSGALPEDFLSVLGKVIYARQFHPAFANALHARLLVLDSPKDRYPAYVKHR